MISPSDRVTILHAGEGQTLIEPGDVGEVAGKPVQGLGEDDFETPGHGVLHELLDAGPHERRPRNGGVGIALKDRPALAGGPLPAQPELIFDGGLVLQVRAVPGVDRAIHRMSFARGRVRRRIGQAA